MTALGKRRAALFVLFFLPGITLSSWVSRTPDVRDLLHASTAEMGLILFGLSAGAMSGILSSGPLVGRLGAQRVILLGTSFLVAAAAVIGIGVAVTTPLVVAIGLALAGYGMGSAEVAANVEGAAVEQAMGRSVLPALHGCFSLGTVVGGGIGMLLTAVACPVPIQLGSVAVLDLAGLLASIRHVDPHVGLRSASSGERTGRAPRPAVWRDPRLVLLGVVLLGLALAEGSATDWLPLLMVDGHGFPPVLGSASFVLFAAAMTTGRFLGGVVVDRLGRPIALLVSGMLGVVGLAVISFVDGQVVAAAAAVLWGLGASLGFPVALSVAADSEHDSAARVSFVATFGYVAFLAGPPVLGFIGQHAGLRVAILPVLVLVAVAASVAPWAARRHAPQPVAALGA